MAPQDRLLSSLAELVAVSTENPPGVTTGACALIAERLAPLGYAISIVSEEPGCDNLTATIGAGAPHLVFNVHLDTVGVGDRAAWSTDPLVLTQRDGRLFGLGAANAKGCAAVHLVLAETLAARGGPERGSVSFTFVTDDENVGPRGTSFLRRQGLRPDQLVIGGPTGNAIILEERGVMWVAIETFGLAAHAGAPDRGDNAIARMMRLLAALDTKLGPVLQDRVDGAQRSTINLGLIQGGANTNVVPDRCRVEIDRRLIVSESVDAAYQEIVAALSSAGEPDGSWSATPMRGTNAFRSAADGALVTAMAEAVGAASGAPTRYVDALGAGDGRYFADDGIQIVTIGPGDGGNSHCPDEWISLAEMEESLAIHLAFLDRIWGVG